MKIILTLLMFVQVVVIASVPADAYVFNFAKATVKVIDEDGKPIANAKAYVFYDGFGGVATKGTASEGNTDSNGKYSVTKINYNGYVGYGAKKDGYYDTHQDFQYKTTGFAHWKPWNPELVIVLRKRVNAVPMYSRDMQYSEPKIEIPVVGKKVGFDLIAYDWVPPYGKGKHSDFIFYLERIYSDWNNQDCRLTISFANKSDGLQKYEENLRKGSALKMPRNAPETGYQNQFQFYINAVAKGPYHTNMNKDDNYFFKIRSSNTAANSSMYGKIRGGFWFWPQHSKKNTATIHMTYYINPDHTRNLEFDPSKNLFGKLPFMEDVRDP